MSDAPNFDFSKFVPGFDFLQNLAKGATQKIPQMPKLGNWVAPTINVEELDKRIDELKAVQFWLDQNAAALKATIQALEVQKMTLATLKGMNFSMGDLANAFKLKTADSVFDGLHKASEKAAEKAPEVAKPVAAPEKPPVADEAAAASAAGGVVDPLQWWNSLTTQFQQIATSAMKDAAAKTAIDSSKNLAANFAKEALKGAGEFAKVATQSMTKPAAKAPAKKAASTTAKAAPAKKAAAKKRTR